MRSKITLIIAYLHIMALVLSNRNLIYCQFCNSLYKDNSFKKHLQFCKNYLKYIEESLLKKIDYFTPSIPFEKLLENKSAIIVGPSVSIQNCNLGNFINSFDIVIRLNKALPLPTNMHPHIGNRTDIIYNSLNQSDYPGENNISPDFFKKNGVKYVRCPYPNISPFSYDIKDFKFKNKNIIQFGHIDLNYYRKLRYNLQTRPYTGTCAIADLLTFKIKKLYVMGIDFYTYSYARYYRTINERKLQKLRNNNIHQRTPQINLIKRFYLLDNRLVVDNILDGLLLEDYDVIFYGIRNHIDMKKTLISSKKYIDNKFNKRRILITNRAIEGYDLIVSFQDKNADIFVTNNIKNANNIKKYCIITNISKNDTNNYYFVNPLFNKYLQTILKNVLPHFSIELFTFLYFSSIYKNSDVYTDIDFFSNWKSYSNRNISISQRMFFIYLIKRGFIKFLTPSSNTS